MATIDLGGPAMAPPRGEKSILVNPPNGNYIAIPLIIICTILTIIFYAMRFYVKFTTKKINVSDYLSLVAFPAFWMYIYYSYRLTYTSGYLVHLWNIPIKDTTAFSYVCFIATLLYLWITSLVKCAILLELNSIFVPDGRRTWFTWTSYAVCGATASLSLIIFIMDLANCTPFSGNYNALIPGRSCKFSVTEFGMASSVTNLVLDVIPLIVVQKMIWSLQLSRKKKIGVSLVFMVGIAACASSLVRTYYATRFYTSSDVSYFYSIMAMCSLGETTCAHMILCAPFVPKAFNSIQKTKIVQNLRSYTLKSEATYANDSVHYRVASKPAVYSKSSKPREHWFMSSRMADTDTVTDWDESSSAYQLTTQTHSREDGTG